MPIQSNSSQLTELLKKFGFEPEKRSLNTSEASEFLSISKSTLYKLTHKKLIPHYKPRGKMVYFDKEELDKYLLKNRVSAKSEIEERALSYVSRTRKTSKL